MSMIPTHEDRIASLEEERDEARQLAKRFMRERDQARAEVERLKASYGWLDERFPEVKAEVVRLTDGIREALERRREGKEVGSTLRRALRDVAGEGASDETR